MPWHEVVCGHPQSPRGPALLRMGEIFLSGANASGLSLALVYFDLAIMAAAKGAARSIVTGVMVSWIR